MTDENCPNGAKLARQFAEQAALIRTGTGEPRTGRDIEHAITTGLVNAYLLGRQAGHDESRTRYAVRARMILQTAIDSLENAKLKTTDTE